MPTAGIYTDSTVNRPGNGRKVYTGDFVVTKDSVILTPEQLRWDIKICFLPLK